MKDHYTPRPDTLAGKVVAHFTQHGGSLRTTEIAERFGVPNANVHSGLATAVNGGLLVMCKVAVPDPRGGRQEQCEYRLSAGGTPRPWREFSMAPDKPPRRASPAPVASDPPADDNCPPTHTAQAADATAPAADKPGESAPNIPGSAVEVLAASISRMSVPSAPDRAPPPPSVAPTAEGRGEVGGRFGTPWWMIDADLCLTIAAGDHNVVIERPHLSELFKFLNRFGDVL